MTKHNLDLRFGIATSIQQYLLTAKHRIAKRRTESIYKITCRCGQCYIRQTGEAIDTRIKEHERDPRSKIIEQSAVTDHDTWHGRDVNNIKVVATTKNLIELKIFQLSYQVEQLEQTGTALVISLKKSNVTLEAVPILQYQLVEDRWLCDKELLVCIAQTYCVV